MGLGSGVFGRATAERCRRAPLCDLNMSCRVLPGTRWPLHALHIVSDQGMRGGGAHFKDETVKHLSSLCFFFSVLISRFSFYLPA